MKRLFDIFITICFCGMLPSFSLAQKVIYVDASVKGGTNGSTWKTAYTSLDDALRQVNSDPETPYEIKVAEGIYYPTLADGQTSRDASFFIVQRKASRVLVGGYPSGGGVRSTDQNKTILSGEIGDSQDSTDNIRQILLLANLTAEADSLVLDGFTISGGYSEYLPEREELVYTNSLNDQVRISPNNISPAILLSTRNGSKTQVRNCIIVANTAKSGSPVTLSESHPSFFNCTFAYNYGNRGGAVTVDKGTLHAEKCQFTKNYSNSYGGAIYVAFGNLYLSKSRVAENLSDNGGGGGIHVNYGSRVVLDETTFFKNTSRGNGAALLLDGVEKVNAFNSDFIENRAISSMENTLASFHGGAIHSTFFFEEKPGTFTLLDCEFSKNEAYSGGALYLFGSYVDIGKCEFAGNKALTGGNLAAGGLKIMESPLIRIRESKVSGNVNGGIEILNSEHVIFEKTEVRSNSGSADNLGGITLTYTKRVEVSECDISHNLGGGLLVSGANETTIERSLIAHNRGGYPGIKFSGDRFRLRNSVVSHNQEAYGGTIGVSASNAEIVNCLVSFNSSLYYGSGIKNNGGICKIYNTTFAKNSVYSSDNTGALIVNGSGGDLEVRNSIIWANQGGSVLQNLVEGAEGTGKAVITNSLIEGGWPGSGNIDKDPLFLNVEGNDFRLQSDSPAIDHGDITGISEILGELELDSRPRVNGTLDLGPYEFDRILSLPVMIGEVKIYPNPVTTGEVRVEFSDQSGEPSRLMLMDLSGRIWLDKTIRSNDFFDMASLPGGIYLLHLKINNQATVRKLVKY